jgi:hypothetical protein
MIPGPTIARHQRRAGTHEHGPGDPFVSNDTSTLGVVGWTAIPSDLPGVGRALDMRDDSGAWWWTCRPWTIQIIVSWTILLVRWASRGVEHSLAVSWSDACVCMHHDERDRGDRKCD